MRKFYVAFLNEDYDVVNSIINLDSGEKANAVTFQSKINEEYINTSRYTFYCNEVVSWSLIEE
jgi:hypothetical protein